MALPVPLLKMIIPSNLAHWNVLKGGSDSITKILDGNEFSVPTQDNQSDAIGRLLMLLAYQFMKCVQMGSGYKDLSRYGTVKNARKAASARCPFYKGLEHIISQCKQRVLTGTTSAPVTTNTHVVTIAPTPAKRNTKSTREAAETSVVVPTHVTGKTPKQNALKVIDDLKAQDDRDIPLTPRQRRILDRKEKCTGAPVREVKSDGSPAKGKECVVCKAQTKFYCLRCKLRLCITQSKAVRERYDSGELPEFTKRHKIKEVDQSNKVEVKFAEGSCWQHIHFESVCQEIKDEHEIPQRLF